MDGAGAGSSSLLAARRSRFGCASADAPWDVRDEEDRGRFRRAENECRILTQDAAGTEGPITFDRCLNRRGFYRMNRVEVSGRPGAGEGSG